MDTNNLLWVLGHKIRPLDIDESYGMVESTAIGFSQKLSDKNCPAIAVYSDFKYSTRSFFSCSVKFSLLKLL